MLNIIVKYKIYLFIIKYIYINLHSTLNITHLNATDVINSISLEDYEQHFK